MEKPGRPHVRLHAGDVYIERVPNYWVLVCSKEGYEQMTTQEMDYMIDRALKTVRDSELPR